MVYPHKQCALCDREAIDGELCPLCLIDEALNPVDTWDETTEPCETVQAMEKAMDLKDLKKLIADLPTPNSPDRPETIGDLMGQLDNEEEEQLARELFSAYNSTGPNPWQTFDGRQVPTWDALNNGDQVRAKWRGVARKAMQLLLTIALFLVPALADASEARIVVECATYKKVIDPEVSATEMVDSKECDRARIYFDIGSQFAGVAFNLDRPRDVLAGFVAGNGYGFRWCPDFWTATNAFLSVDVFLNGGLDLKEDEPDAVMIGLSTVVTLFSIIGGGVGWLWELGFGDRLDVSRPIGLLAAVTSW